MFKKIISLSVAASLSLTCHASMKISEFHQNMLTVLTECQKESKTDSNNFYPCIFHFKDREIIWNSKENDCNFIEKRKGRIVTGVWTVDTECYKLWEKSVSIIGSEILTESFDRLNLDSLNLKPFKDQVILLIEFESPQKAVIRTARGPYSDVFMAGGGFDHIYELKDGEWKQVSSNPFDS